MCNLSGNWVAGLPKEQRKRVKRKNKTKTTTIMFCDFLKYDKSFTLWDLDVHIWSLWCYCQCYFSIFNLLLTLVSKEENPTLSKWCICCLWLMCWAFLIRTDYVILIKTDYVVLIKTYYVILIRTDYVVFVTFISCDILRWLWAALHLHRPNMVTYSHCFPCRNPKGYAWDCLCRIMMQWSLFMYHLTPPGKI